MSLHHNQKFQVGGTQWRYEKNSLPQGSLIGTAKDGSNLSNVIAKDWSKPVSAPNNAVLLTRSSIGNKWEAAQATDLKSALRQGSRHIRSYEQDRDIAKVEAYFQPLQRTQDNATNLKPQRGNQAKPPKFRTITALMQWQQEQKAKGASTHPADHGKDQDMGMG